MVEYIKTLDEFDAIVCDTFYTYYIQMLTITQIAKAKDAGKVVLVDYTAAWCGPCRVINPVVDKLAEKADSSRIEFYKVDVDDAAEIARKAGVSSVCFLHIFPPGYLAFKLMARFQPPDAYISRVQLKEPNPQQRLCRAKGCHPSEAGGPYRIFGAHNCSDPVCFISLETDPRIAQWS
jgi:thiol-disulfide isomerase/thioredoxin